MKKGIGTIFRKEMARFFGDRRLAITTILVPGLMIFVLYTLMGTAIGSKFSVGDDFVPSVQAVYLPQSVSALAEQAGLDILPADDVAAARAAVEGQELNALLVFPEDFDARVEAYDPASGAAAPAVELYYNSADTDSGAAYNILTQLLDSYERTLANKFDVNPGGGGDLASAEDTAGTFLSSMLPMLLILFLFSGCMGIAPESIAGEKERGTIATLLITPMKRSHLALGKIFALSIIGLLSGLSSTVGTLLSMPQLMQMGEELSIPYTPAHYAALAAVILVTVLLIVAAISIISAFAKSIKEAQSYVSPLMILVMLVGVFAMFGGGAQTAAPLYLVPFYNSVQCMVGIFSFQLNVTHLIITVAANLVYTGLGAFVLTRMFNSENMMFRR